jgi:hypothetical protein
LPPLGKRGGDDGVGDLVLCPIAAVRDHKVDTIAYSVPSLIAGIAIAVRHAGVPGHTVFAENIIENVEDGLILA